MNLSELNKESAVCSKCKGKPDEVYFKSTDGKDGEILAIICTPCKQVIEATIRSIGRMFGSRINEEEKEP